MSNIAFYLAPKDFKLFKKWHALACPSDELTAEERFLKEGGTIPDEKPKKGK